MSERGHPVRLARERTLRSVYAGDDEVLPPPPYVIRDIEMLYILVSLDEDAVRSALPFGLEPSLPAQGLFCAITASDGWVIAPFSAGFATIQVKGLSTEADWPANYIHSSWYTPVAARAMRTYYNDGVREGETAFVRSGDRIVSVTRQDGEPIMRISASRTERVGQPVGGTSHYVSPYRGGLRHFSTIWNSRMRDAEDVSIEISDAAPPLLRQLRPQGIVWPLTPDNLTLTFSQAGPIEDFQQSLAADAMRSVLLDLFAKLGRAAAVVADGGRLVAVNDEANSIFGDGAVAIGGRLTATRPASQRLLEASVARTIATGRLSDPITLDRQGTSLPLIAQALPIDPAFAGEKSALVIFVDPARQSRLDAAGLFQLMGLTPAEARIAALVGSGVVPRQAAERLGITENTLRTTTHLVYEKLGIARQSDLTQIVGRLEFLAGG